MTKSDIMNQEKYPVDMKRQKNMMKEIIKKKMSKRNTGDIQDPTLRIQKPQSTQLKRKTT